MGNKVTDTVFVDVYKSKLPWNGKPWRFKVVSADNFEKLAQGQAYKTEAAAIHGAELVCGDDTNAYLRRAEHGNELLRPASGQHW
jgi:uncharacterized protein YegP (UPF0339 family)